MCQPAVVSGEDVAARRRTKPSRVPGIRFEPALSRFLPGHAQRLRRGQAGVAAQPHDVARVIGSPSRGRYLTGPEAETATMTGTVNSAPWPAAIRSEVRQEPGVSPPPNVTMIGSPPWAGTVKVPLGQ